MSGSAQIDATPGPIDEALWLELYARLRDVRDIDRAPLALALMGQVPERTGLGHANRTFWAHADHLKPKRHASEGRLQCSHCDEWLEIPLGSNFQMPEARADTAKLTFDGQDYDLRLPTVIDPRRGANWMTALCEDGPWENAEFRALAADALEQAEPALEIAFNITCSSCEGQLQGRLDPFAFFWSALQARARTLINEIARLASAFGWTERECLELGPVRRALYLERIA